jgi:hypothetical protein
VSTDPARTFRDLQRIWSKLFIPENLAASKSWDYLNNTRYYPNDLLPSHSQFGKPRQTPPPIFPMFNFLKHFRSFKGFPLR